MAKVAWLDCSCAGGYVRVWASIDERGRASFIEGEVEQGQGPMGSDCHINGNGTSDVAVWEEATGRSWEDIQVIFEVDAAHERDPSSFDIVLPDSLLTRQVG